MNYFVLLVLADHYGFFFNCHILGCVVCSVSELILKLWMFCTATYWCVIEFCKCCPANESVWVNGATCCTQAHDRSFKIWRCNAVGFYLESVKLSSHLHALFLWDSFSYSISSAPESSKLHLPLKLFDWNVLRISHLLSLSSALIWLL